MAGLSNVGMLMMCTTTGMNLVNEFMHFCCHLGENWFVRHSPFVNTLRRHHTAHYNSHLMKEVKMNLTSSPSRIGYSEPPI